MSDTTFHLPAKGGGERWTARAGQELVGRSVEYNGRRVGEVARTVPVDAGRALRVHVALSDSRIKNPDRAKFSLGSEKRSAKADE